jgi:branched-chain amino acid transport system substrate-binding protein
LVVEVDAFDAEAVRGAFGALVDCEVDALTSGYFLTEENVVSLAAEYGAPYLHGQTAESYVEYVRQDPTGHGRMFQICPSEMYYGSGFVRFLDELVATGSWTPASRRLVFIETPVSGGAIASRDAVEFAERSGWQVTAVERVPSSGANWVQVIDVLRHADPAALMIANFVPEELANFQRSFVQNPTPALVYAVYAPSIPRFFEDAQDAAEGMLWATVSGTYGDILGRRFATSYERAFSRPPGRAHAGIAYDGVQLLARAWAEVDNPRNFADVARRLRTNTHRGVNGSYFFDTDGQCGLSYPDTVVDPSLGQAHLVLQIRGGRHHVLSPRPYVEGSFRSPPWCD